MKNHLYAYALLFIVANSFISSAQTADDYKSITPSNGSGLLDTSRFSIHHALSFGMVGSQGIKTQSSSMYSTLMSYKFAVPVTLNLNFGMPLYSTFNPAQNLNAQTLNSADYFKSMPFDVSLTWKPRENMLMRFSVIKSDQSLFLNQPLFGLNSTHSNW